MGLGFFRKKSDEEIINEAKEKFIKNVLEYLKEESKDEQFLNNVIEFVKRNNPIREKYGVIVKETLEAASEEFFVENGKAKVTLGYYSNNIENAEKCLHKILADYPEEFTSTYKQIIFFTKSYLETVSRNFSNEFDKKIFGKNVPDSFKAMFWSCFEFYESWNKLIKTENIVHLENFAKKFVDSGFTQEDVHKLNQLIQHNGLEINSNIIRKTIEQIQLSIKRNRLEDRIREINPQTMSDYLDAYFEMYGENYLDNIDALRELLKKKNISYEGTIRENVDAHKKNIEMNKYAQSLREPIKHHSYSIQSIDQMDGWEFEKFLKELFTKMGYDVELTKGSGDQGADLVLSKMGEKTVVQAKQYSTKVPNSAVQEITAAIKHYQAYHGMVITSNDFQPSAIELAESNGIQLVNRAELSDLIKKYM